jgi:hypothetical protein
MAERSRVDPSYADIVGGILMGTVPQSQTTNLEVARGTIEQAMLSTGLTNLLETIQNPNAMAKATIEALQTSVDISIQAIQNPAAFLSWAIKSTTSAINLAIASTNNNTENIEKTCN